MQYFKQEIKVGEASAPLTCYLPDAAPRTYFKENRPAIIVLPGGGYEMTYPGEGEPIALEYLARGFCAFVLDYSVYPARFPQALLEALHAIRFVRENAKEYGIDPVKIAICGFSAGGHLAITAAEKFDYGKSDGDEIDKQNSRPDAAVFCYPVCTLLGEYTHKGSVKNLLGTDEPTDLAYKLSGELNARDDMPPCFIWHTFGDTCVPVQNSLMLADALRKKNIPVEMHLFPDGPHGLGLAEKIPHTAQWAPLLCNWLRHQQF